MVDDPMVVEWVLTSWIVLCREEGQGADITFFWDDDAEIQQSNDEYPAHEPKVMHVHFYLYDGVQVLMGDFLLSISDHSGLGD